MLSNNGSHIDRFCHTALILVLSVGLHSFAAAQSENADPKLTGSPTYSLPSSAIDAEIGGTVVVAVRVDETGKPTNADLTVGPAWPCGTKPVKALEELSSSLSRSIMSFKFEPALANGKPVAKIIGLTFQLKNPKFTPAPAAIDPATGKPKATTIMGGVVNGKARSLPKPIYPASARAHGDSGAVSVQVLIDEEGKIVWAGAVSGATRLQFAAREAACGAKFSRTTLMGNPVKVSGVITYNFVP
jgi:TonB family protein